MLMLFVGIVIVLILVALGLILADKLGTDPTITKLIQAVAIVLGILGIVLIANKAGVF